MNSNSAATKQEPVALPALAMDLLFKRQGWQDRWGQYKATQPAIAKKRLPWVILLLVSIWVFSQHLAICPVITRSVDANLVLVLKNQPARKGDFVAFVYTGQEIGGHKKGEGVVKVLAGLPGDRITRVGRDFYLNGKHLGYAKEYSGVGDPSILVKALVWLNLVPKSTSVALQASESVVIPPGYVWVQGTDKDALDSRYVAMGLVPTSSFIGRAIKVF